MNLKTLYILILFAPCHSFSQELKLDVLVGTNFFENIELELNTYSPENSYFTYDGEISNIAVLNSFRTGISLGVEFRKFRINFEPQFAYERTQVEFPLEFEIERIHVTKGFRLPVIFSYKFFKKENSLSFVGGIILNKFNGLDFQSPGNGYFLGSQEPYEETINVGPNHFNGKLYSESFYLDYAVGLGRNFGNWNHSIRFVKNFPYESARIEANSFQVEYVLSLNLLSSKNFTNKHFLYVE